MAGPSASAYGFAGDGRAITINLLNDVEKRRLVAFQV